MNSNEKIYGASILNLDERIIDENDNIFDELKDAYTDKEIADMRKELKDSSVEHRTKDMVYTDAISGIKSAEKIKKPEAESISDIIDSKEKTGKEISSAGIDLIYNLLDTKPTDEELSSLSNFFKGINRVDDIYAIDVLVLKNILGKRITNKLTEIAEKNHVLEYEAITKFLCEIYNSYINIVQYNDDINELYDLVTKLDIDNIDVNDEDSLLKQYDLLMNATEKFKNLDDRNRRLKNDYKVTDFDILAIESVKKCLEEALSFSRVYDKADNTPPKKFKSNMKKIDEVKQSIGNWINDLKNDPETLFTFPVNDYLTAIESVDGMIDYIKGFIMLQDKHEIYMKVSEDTENQITDVTEYFLSNGYVTKHNLDNYEQSAITLLYFLSKTFKKKKMKTNDDRRILSYTLDVISKASNVKYVSIIMKLINYISEKFLNIDSYDYIKTDD